ncbi:MAG: NB-ARC domain-containing protein [Streptosporangiaceae bacterium]
MTGRAGGNLPAEISSFVGRGGEIAEIATLVRTTRLVTVTGVGGVGKTRTALRSAAAVHADFPDGVWLVELSGLMDDTLIAHTVADTLGLQDQTLRSQVDVLADYLVGRRLLLILDTCEHLSDTCAVLAEVLLAAAPGLHVLATSRRSLGTTGERLYAVRPLPVPSEGPAAWPNDSIRLFTDRARAVDPDFTLTSDKLEPIAQLCRRLDGIPLALELAAVWLRTLTPEQITDRLTDRFKLLSEGDLVSGRHETLRTTIGWSHELCSPAERLLWARISVFPGSFDAVSAAQVCGDERLPAAYVPALIEGLVDKSILQRDRGGRFRLLDTLREYGEEWLIALEELDLHRRRHRDHYLRIARDYEKAWCGPDQVRKYNDMKREQPNLRTALEFCLADSREYLTGLRMLGALYLFWASGGIIREGRQYFDRLMSTGPAPGPELTKVLWSCARLATIQGDLDTADSLLRECHPYAVAQRDLVAQGNIVYLAGAIAMLRGDHAGAIPLLEESARVNRDGGDPCIVLIMTLAVHAMVRVLLGETERSIELSEECQAVARSYGERWAGAFGDYTRALAEMRRGNVPAAIEHARTALRFKSQLNDSFGCALALDLLAVASAADGEPDRAARLLGFAGHVWHSFGLPQIGSPDLAAARRHCEQQARDALGDGPYGLAFQEGWEFTLDAGFEYAIG